MIAESQSNFFAVVWMKAFDPLAAGLGNVFQHEAALIVVGHFQLVRFNIPGVHELRCRAKGNGEPLPALSEFFFRLKRL